MTRDFLVPLVSGTIFGGGLALGGMTDPARVRGFLDLFGAWDPTLAFVMGGAVLVMALAWLVQKRMQRPVFATGFSLPDRSDITPRLVGGSALFGIGWGITGFCPGGALPMIGTGNADVLIFIAAMVAGITAARLAIRARDRGAKPAPFRG
jgi:uncharacterized membrane protein YedE/YeeE